MTQSGYPTRAFDVRVNTINGSTVLVRGMDAFELDDVAALVWSNCDGSRDVASLAELVVAEYDVATEQAAADVTAFLAALRDAALVDMLVSPVSA